MNCCEPIHEPNRTEPVKKFWGWLAPTFVHVLVHGVARKACPKLIFGSLSLNLLINGQELSSTDSRKYYQDFQARPSRLDKTASRQDKFASNEMEMTQGMSRSL